MYKIFKMIVLGMLAFLSSHVYAIKLTNNTNEDLLYRYNQSIVISKPEKHELRSKETVEIPYTTGSIQIYTKQKPKTLSGMYNLTDQMEDLAIVLSPLRGFAFKQIGEFSHTEVRKTPFVGAQSIFENFTQNKGNNPKIKTEAKESRMLEQLTKTRPIFPGRRRPTIKKKQPYQNNNDSNKKKSYSTEQKASTKDPIRSSSIIIKPLLVKQSIYKRYLTKKSLALGLGLATVGIISYGAWFFYNLKIPCI